MALWGDSSNNKSENNINKYTSFNNNNSKVKDIVERLSAESISLWGIDLYYITVDDITDINIDKILLEKNKNVYSNIHKIRMMLEDPSGNGGTDTYGIFQLKLENRIEFIIDMNTIHSIIGRQPRINDLVYHEPSKYLYKVTFVEDEYLNNAYMGGYQYMYLLKCVNYMKTESDEFTIRKFSIDELNELDKLTTNEIIDDNDNIDNTEPDPFLEG